MCAAVVLVGELLVGPLRGSVGVADNDLERWFAAHRTGLGTSIAADLTLLGETVTALILTPVLALSVWLWKRAILPVAFMVAAVVGQGAVYLVTVNIVNRPRPPVPLLDKGLDPTHSYPSGHVAAATAMYGAAAVLLWTYGSARWRWLGVVLLVLPLLVALSRLYEGVHHLSDVVASLMFVAGWLTIEGSILLRAARTVGTPDSASQRPSAAQS